jgi:Ca2+-binding RTX toxin-like protein
MGGTGDDLYVLDTSGDVVLELAGEGADTVQASFSYTLGDNVEKLVLTGSGAINGTGNALANTLVGNSAANLLSGLDGNDSIDGGSGIDSVSGGAGNDTLAGGSGDDDVNGGAGVDILSGGAGKDDFHFSKGEIAGDTIQDFTKGDHILLHGYAAGSTVTKVAGSATDWIVTDHSTGATELFHLANSYALKSSDFLFG